MANRVSADDYREWALLLRSLWARTDADFQGHIDPEDEAALVLVETLEPAQLGKLGYALLEHSPGLMQRFLGELVEALSARGEHDAVRAVLAVKDRWNEEV